MKSVLGILTCVRYIKRLITMKLKPLIQNNIYQLQRRYSALKLVEQRIVLGLIAAISATLFWFIILGPLLKLKSDYEADYHYQRKLAMWMNSNASQLNAVAVTGGTAQNPDQNLVQIINSTTQQTGVTLRRFEPIGEGAYRVWFEGADFNPFLNWIFLLQSGYQISPQRLTINAEESSGTIRATVELATI